MLWIHRSQTFSSSSLLWEGNFLKTPVYLIIPLLMNSLVHVFLGMWASISVGYIVISGIAWSQDISIFSFNKQLVCHLPKWLHQKHLCDKSTCLSKSSETRDHDDSLHLTCQLRSKFYICVLCVYMFYICKTWTMWGLGAPTPPSLKSIYNFLLPQNLITKSTVDRKPYW